MVTSEVSSSEHSTVGKQLSDLPMRKGTAAQLQDEAFVMSFVFTVQDVWRSRERIIRKLPRDHLNYQSICRDIRKAFSACLPRDRGLLVGATGKQLRTSISEAAHTFKQSSRLPLSKYTRQIDLGSYSVMEDMMSQIDHPRWGCGSGFGWCCQGTQHYTAGDSLCQQHQMGQRKKSVGSRLGGM
jgi:hypothetical protein